MRAPSKGRLLLRGYAPLVTILATLALLVAFVPSKAPERRTVSVSGPGVAGGPGLGQPGAGGGSTTTAPGSEGTGTATGEGGSGQGPPAGSEGATVELASTCEGGTRQTREPYSPPCIAFSGDNGGATSRGGTADTITITVQEGALPSLYAVAGQAAQKANINDTAEDLRRTTLAFVDYFNTRFQLYGRKVELRFFTGQGDQLSEFFGAGGETANADALRVAQEVGAFADLSVLTAPYAEALTRQGVIAIPPPHFSQSWYDKHAPYAYGVVSDCSRIVETASDWIANRVAGHPARYAGDPAYRSQTRRLGLITPEQPWYQECANDGARQLRDRGVEYTHRVNYTLDFNRLSTDAVGMIAQMKARGVTTIVCTCDPLLPIFLTAQATQQGCFPEWVESYLGTNAAAIDRSGPGRRRTLRVSR
ncbi:MAG: hypothetical protein ACRD0U_17305 [Acidimicrobiales bacterium]